MESVEGPSNGPRLPIPTRGGDQPLDLLSEHPKEDRHGGSSKLLGGKTPSPWPGVNPEQPEIKRNVGIQVQLQGICQGNKQTNNNKALQNHFLRQPEQRKFCAARGKRALGEAGGSFRMPSTVLLTTNGNVSGHWGLRKGPAHSDFQDNFSLKALQALPL